MKNKSCIIIALVLMSLMFIGGLCDTTTAPPAPTPPPPDYTLSDDPYNGDWVFIKYTYYGMDYTLKDSLYQSDETVWAALSLCDYVDANAHDDWEYQEYSMFLQPTSGAGGALIYYQDMLILNNDLGMGGSELWNKFFWQVSNDTLYLYHEQSYPYRYYTLIPEDVFTVPEPDLRDTDFNGDWVFVTYGFQNDTYPLEDSLFTNPQADFARIEFRDYAAEYLQDKWRYEEHDSETGLLNAKMGDLVVSQFDHHLDLYVGDQVNNALWYSFYNSLQSTNPDTLMLSDNSNPDVWMQLVPDDD